MRSKSPKSIAPDRIPFLANPHILIVGSKNQSLKKIFEFLSTKKCRIDSIGSFADALKRASEVLFDIIVVDIVARGDQDFESIAALKQMAPEAEIIIVHPKSMISQVSRIVRDSLFYILYKPVDIELFAITVLNALERKRLVQENREYQNKLEKKVIERTGELKAVQERLLQTEKLAALGQSLAGIVHEVNNPLSVIYGRTQLLLMQKNIPETIMRNIRIIEDQVHKTKNITSRILKFSKPSRPQPVKTNIANLVNDVIVLLDYDFAIQNIKVSKSFTCEGTNVFCDPDQIQEALTNIMINAKHAMPSGGNLDISVFEKGDTVNIAVADNGCGIKQDDVKKLFDPFFTTKSEGTGLGLPICYGIIREHHGNINVTSKVGEGTTFTISLPLP